MGNRAEESVKETENKGWKFSFNSTEDDTSSLSSYDKISDEVEKQCQCSWKTRIIGFLICCIFGWVISAVSSIAFFFRHDAVQFALFYSLGQILNISGYIILQKRSCFLSGPIQQLRNMAKQTRILLSALYIGSLIGTLVMAFLLPDNLKILVVVMLIIQIASYFLYTFSYLPFGRTIIRTAFRTALE